MRAVIYVRVSTDGQERDGTSLETQEEACIKHAEARGWEVVECVRDTTSGFTLERPGLEQARRYVRDGHVDIVLAYAVDRLSRNQNHVGILFDEVDRHDVKLDFVTEAFEETAVGRFIINVRAFVAEMEREKIAERTMRGKTARAKSGGLPQGTGKGMYGYRYNRETGHREIDEYQAGFVRRIFTRYAETRSFSAVSNDLNGAGVPAFAGGRWYPLTIRRILLSETYTGRTIYRRLKRVTVRNGKAHSRVVERPSEEWIEIEGATPRIIDDVTWERVQQILADPERLRRKPEGRHYRLGSRVRCGVCGAAMVGQTLTSRGKLYRYYRCRHVYDKNSGRDCSARYVSADDLETGVWREVKRILCDPDVVLAELLRASEGVVDDGERVRLEEELHRLEKREKRLVQLFMEDDLNKEALREEAANLRRQKEAVSARLRTVASARRDAPTEPDSDRLRLICRLIAEELDSPSEERCAQVLEALQITVEATRDGATIRGILPAQVPGFVTIERSSA